jgi:DNA polymerase III delta subunit
VKFVIHVKGPSDAGPGERQEMLERSRRLLAQAGIEPSGIVRIDVPSRGAEEPGEGGVLRPAVEPVVPALQSGSLFGDRQGVEVLDAHSLQAAEGDVIIELLEATDPEAVTVVFLTTGALPARLAKAVRSLGEVIEVKKLRERDAADWLAAEIRDRNLKINPDGAGALLQRFGSDVASMSQALDQLSADEGVSRDDILARFRNRPDEPMWHYADAVAAGDIAEALRRLADFLVHGHPLQLMGFLESDLRRKALAAVAPNLETLAEWLGTQPTSYPVQKAWRQRGSTSDSELQRALTALSRADRLLKTAPDDMHRVTMERLTVALCLWYQGKGRRAS